MGYAGIQPQYGTFPSDLFTGNGSNTVFTMSSVPGNDAALLVTVDGVRQHTDTYSFSANTLTFSEAPGNGAIIETVNMGSRADIIITEGVYKKTQFTATASQTNFTISTGYTVGFVDVYLNGIRLVVADDFTANDGSTIILATAAAAGDSVEVVAYGTFNVANALLKSGDTMSGNLVVSGTSTLQSPVAIANTTGNTFVIANTGAVTSSSNTLTVGTTVYVVANGNVGIGTNAPSQKIEMVGATARLTNDSYIGYLGAGSLLVSGSSTDFTLRSDNVLSFGTGGPYERMRIDTSGRVTKPNQPAFSARQTSTGLTTTADAEQKFDVIIFNTGSHYNASTGRFTAPVAGRYYFAAQMLGNNTNNRGIFYIAKNNSVSVPSVEASATASLYTNIQTFALLDLAAGDYVSVKNAGSAEAQWYGSPSNQNWFIGYLLG